MLQSLFACPFGLSRMRSAAPPAALGPQLLAAGTALALVAAVLTWPSGAIRTGDVAELAPLSITLTAVTPPALSARAEALRERLQMLPGVGAVALRGLQQQRLFVEYSPARLASLGLTAGDLAASIPTDPAATTPGHLAVRLDVARQGLQAVENLPVRAGTRAFRLGDVALVARAPLDPPVSTLSRDGQPAVEVVVTPARGADKTELRGMLATVE